jgi:hypothetical protein
MQNKKAKAKLPGRRFSESGSEFFIGLFIEVDSRDQLREELCGAGIT